MESIDKYVKEATITLADDPKATEETWQAPFEQNTECCHCGENARLALVFREDQADKKYISDIHDNTIAKGGKFWPHDAVAIAIYFCEKCYEPTAEYNQA